MAETKSKFEILKEEIEKMSKRTSDRSQNNKLKSFRIYIGIAISSALITILVAIGNDVKEEWRLIVKLVTLILSGLSTVLAAWDGFYNHKQLWINYGDTRNQLSALILKMNLVKEEDKKDDKVIDDFYKEYQEVLQNGNVKWKEMRIDEKGA